MRCSPVCKPCLERLLSRAVELAAGADPGSHRRAAHAARDELERLFRVGESVPTRIATRCLRRIQQETGQDDPFAPVKREEIEAARRTLPSVEPLSGDPLSDCLRLSALGNRLDFFRPLREVEREWRGRGHLFALDHSEALAADLSRCRNLLFLTDNAGEALFDLPLLRHLCDSDIAVTVAVKGKPSQNDLTRADAQRWRLPLPNLIDTGTDDVGCELDRAGPDLRRAWGHADVVLAKGMANFETLSEYPACLAEKAVYFLLCAKCPPVASQWGVEVGASLLVSSGSWQKRMPR